MLVNGLKLVQESKNPPPVKIEQCLFGYEGGHRLLASSAKLPPDAESIILRLSDLAPGANGHSELGYWTGFPLAPVNSYALMRTWSAYEMPRPGSVWTHALLISNADFARFSDLAILRDFVERPSSESGFSKYQEALHLSEFQLKGGEDYHHRFLDSQDLLKLIRPLYGSRDRVVLFSPHKDLDGAIFRIWSQQWPRLRRSFSFRTTGRMEERQTQGIDFDLRILTSSEKSHTKKPLVKSDDIHIEEETEALILDDAMSPQGSSFRKFLWRYGSDVANGRQSFALLARLYLMVNSTHFSSTEYESLLEQVSSSLPDPSEGRALKSDLIERGFNKHSLIHGFDTLNTVRFFVHNPEVKGWPQPTDSPINAAVRGWPQRSNEILELAEEAAEIDTPLSKSILREIVSSVSRKDLIKAIMGKSRLAFELAKVEPTLIDNLDMKSLASHDFTSYLTTVSSENETVQRTVKRIVKSGDEGLIDTFSEQYPSLVLEAVVSELSKKSCKIGGSIPASWATCIKRDDSKFLESGYIEKADSLSLLRYYAKALGYKNSKVIDKGPLPWSIAIVDAEDNLDFLGKTEFYSFMAKLIFTEPSLGSEPIFERIFDHLHNAFRKEKIPKGSLLLFENKLPQVDWWKQWDSAYRFELGVVRCFINNDLSRDSFYRLTNDKKVMLRLEDIAKDVSGGSSYLSRR